MTNEIVLRHASPRVQKALDDLGEEDKERIGIGAFLMKIDDYRALIRRGDVAAAARYHDMLMAELRALREHYSDLKTYTAAGAGAGAAAGAWLFGVGAIAGGLAGGALGYFLAKEEKEAMLEVCDALLVELGARPAEP
ncbi:MAG: hypothetical protein CMN30_33980 [Sandaracinus sp.]|nr:hypothetical protein [Sandaracinus sp.]|tara:strand:- start:3303 stop:3716 length:414 start_codon:yes stop_codon:yes gene_type:complete